MLSEVKADAFIATDACAAETVAPAELSNNTLPLCPAVGLLNVNSLTVLVGVALKLLPSAKSKTPALPSSTILPLTALL